MPFIEKVKQFATGKTAIERRQEAVANQIIRQKAFASQLKERERQAVRFAAEKEKVAYDRRITALRQPPRKYDSPMNGGFANMFGNLPQTSAKKKMPKAQKYRVIWTSWTGYGGRNLPQNGSNSCFKPFLAYFSCFLYNSLSP